MATLKDQLEARVAEYDRWAIRRQFGADGPNMRRLWILTCMDERLPVDEALGIRADSPVGGGDAHLFRNAGGIVTDDAIRSAMLTINFFGTKEIIVLQHTGCGMLSANGNDVVAALQAKGIDTDSVPIDPSLPELSLQPGAFGKWIGMMDDADETCIKCVDYLRAHPLIPDDITISGWIWETELRRLRAPTTYADARPRTQYSTATMGVQGPQPGCRRPLASGVRQGLPLLPLTEMTHRPLGSAPRAPAPRRPGIGPAPDRPCPRSCNQPRGPAGPGNGGLGLMQSPRPPTPSASGVTAHAQAAGPTADAHHFSADLRGAEPASRETTRL